MTNRDKIHFYIYFFGLSLVCIGMPTSRFLMGLSLFVIAGNWLLEGKVIKKFISFFKNKPALIVVSFYLLYVIGSIYSSDYQHLLKELRIKAVFLVFPILISTSKKLDFIWFKYLMYIFILSTVVSSLVTIYIHTTQDLLDYREAFVFVSHIRMSLFLCLSFFLSLYFIFNKKTKRYEKRVLIPICIWFIIFMMMMKLMTGISVLVIAGLILAIYLTIKHKKGRSQKLILFALFLFPVIILVYVNQVRTKYFQTKTQNIETLDEFTKNGNPYSHNIESEAIENGNLIWLYVCEKELSEAWKKRSEIPYFGKDRRDQLTSSTLIRFLSSKGLRKDAQALESLSEKEILSIENGIANVLYMKKFNFTSRIHKIIWEYGAYKNHKNPNYHSVVQRIEYWRTAIDIIKKNPVFGVGTGDLKQAFKNQYKKNKSRLEIQNRWMSHNQFLTVMVVLGIVGLLWFLFVLIYPPLYLNKFNQFFFISFFLILVLSMLTDDTLQRQAGVSFYAFFNALFLFGIEGEDD